MCLAVSDSNSQVECQKHKSSLILMDKSSIEDVDHKNQSFSQKLNRVSNNKVHGQIFFFFRFELDPNWLDSC